jgi:hypothetical protein
LAEDPSFVNSYRYLILFDNAHADYVNVEDIAASFYFYFLNFVPVLGEFVNTVVVEYIYW